LASCSIIIKGRDCDVAVQSYLVVPDAVLPAACANTVEGRAGAISVLESTAVQRQTHDDLVRGHSMAGVILYGSIGAEGSCFWPLLRGENVGLVACDLVPRSCVVVRHQVPEVKVAVHLLERQVGEVCRSGWRSDRQEEVGPRRQGSSVCIEFVAGGGEKSNKVRPLLWCLGILPVNVKAIEGKVLEQGDSALGKLLPAFRGRGWHWEVGTVSPTANRQEDFQVAVTLLVDVQLFQAAVEVVAGVVPGVSRPVFVGVCPAVGQVDLAALRTDVGESVQNMGEFVGGDILRLVVTTIDGPILQSSLVFAVLGLRIGMTYDKVGHASVSGLRVRHGADWDLIDRQCVGEPIEGV
jgi:hypothetical protein